MQFQNYKSNNNRRIYHVNHDANDNVAVTSFWRKHKFGVILTACAVVLFGLIFAMLIVSNAEAQTKPESEPVKYVQDWGTVMVIRGETYRASQFVPSNDKQTLSTARFYVNTITCQVYVVWNVKNSSTCMPTGLYYSGPTLK